MIGLPKPVASLHNSWLSQKGPVLAQPLLPGSEKCREGVVQSWAVFHPISVSISSASHPAPLPTSCPMVHWGGGGIFSW